VADGSIRILNPRSADLSAKGSRPFFKGDAAHCDIFTRGSEDEIVGTKAIDGIEVLWQAWRIGKN
jgi:hypothetical protein